MGAGTLLEMLPRMGGVGEEGDEEEKAPAVGIPGLDLRLPPPCLESEPREAPQEGDGQEEAAAVAVQATADDREGVCRVDEGFPPVSSPAIVFLWIYACEGRRAMWDPFDGRRVPSCPSGTDLHKPD